MDIGDNDQELEMAQRVEAQFNDFRLTHEWHLYSGAHTEAYWHAHVEEYIRWYAEGWKNPQEDNAFIIPACRRTHEHPCYGWSRLYGFRYSRCTGQSRTFCPCLRFAGD